MFGQRALICYLCGSNNYSTWIFKDYTEIQILCHIFSYKYTHIYETTCPDIQIVGVEYVENDNPILRIILLVRYPTQECTTHIELCLVVLESGKKKKLSIRIWSN